MFTRKLFNISKNCITFYSIFLRYHFIKISGKRSKRIVILQIIEGFEFISICFAVLKKILIWTLHVEANQQQYRCSGTVYSSPYTNILIPAARNQCNATWCNCNWSHTIFMAIQRSYTKHLFNTNRTVSFWWAINSFFYSNWILFTGVSSSQRIPCMHTVIVRATE